MKKAFIWLFALVLIPHLVFAATWWNPFSWFDLFFSSSASVSVPFTPINHVVSTSTHQAPVATGSVHVNTTVQNQKSPQVVTPAVQPIVESPVQVTVPVPKPVSVTPVVEPVIQVPPPADTNANLKPIIESLSDIDEFCFGQAPSGCIVEPDNRLSVSKVTPGELTLTENNWSGLPGVTVTGSNLGNNGATVVYYGSDPSCNLDTRVLDKFHQTTYIDVTGCRTFKVNSVDNNTAYFSIPSFVQLNNSVRSGTGDYLTFVIASQSDFGSSNTTGYARFNIPIVKK